MSMLFFPYIQAIQTKSEEPSVEDMPGAHYNVRKQISANICAIPVLEYLNNMTRLPEWVQGICLYQLVPKHTPTRKYLPKKDKAKYETVKVQRQKERVKGKFNVSDVHLDQVMRILENNNILIGE